MQINVKHKCETDLNRSNKKKYNLIKQNVTCVLYRFTQSLPGKAAAPQRRLAMWRWCWDQENQGWLAIIWLLNHSWELKETKRTWRRKTGKNHETSSLLWHPWYSILAFGKIPNALPWYRLSGARDSKRHVMGSMFHRSTFQVVKYWKTYMHLKSNL